LSKYGSEAMAGELDAIPLREGDSQSTMGVSFGGSIPKMDVKSVKDGDVIDLGGHVLRIIETPGHTAGSICIFDESTGTLFSGDLFFFDGVGRTDLPTGSSDDLIKSLIKLKNLEFTGLSSGHGPVVSNNGPVYLQNSLRMMGVNQ
ncbi:MAG: MBL fold metallo-hydrolase, partial [Candidatus Methanomethylophilaceae archaeon]|nr:MBL fold metallo-hydrolase [Candidatus Methanomethylophilaceae archaeon]